MLLTLALLITMPYEFEILEIPRDLDEPQSEIVYATPRMWVKHKLPWIFGACCTIFGLILIWKR